MVRFGLGVKLLTVKQRPETDREADADHFRGKFRVHLKNVFFLEVEQNIYSNKFKILNVLFYFEPTV